MIHRSLADAVNDLEAQGRLVRVDHPVDPYLEVAEIQRRLYRNQAPAVLFTNAKGCRFPLLANLFGTIERARFLFRHTLDDVRNLTRLKVDPGEAFRNPWKFRNVPLVLSRLLPKYVARGAVDMHTLRLSELPHVTGWPADGGPFITLPQVYTEHPDRPGWRHSNLGMYRVQLAGNDYDLESEVGLHYQIQRGIGVHHAAAIARGESLKVNIAVGGPPAFALGAVMPLPEGLPELAFIGVLGGRRVRLSTPANGLPHFADADFVLSGFIESGKLKDEGPFGDHLGYYSLKHPFPVLRVTSVRHRPGAIWPFTIVGRPPQEDTVFGELIHDLTGPAIPAVLPGVHAVHAVDAAGVHPLLLAIASERYVPYAQNRRPQEMLTIASAILGQGQLSLAKYLLMVAREDDPSLEIHDLPRFFHHLLERVDWTKDLHFHAASTIDTLDYSAGEGLNWGSKLVITAAGEKRRDLPTALPSSMKLPEGFSEPRVLLPGILAVRAPCHSGRGPAEYEPALTRFCDEFGTLHRDFTFPLIVLVDDSDFAARRLENWIWAVFTKSNPAADVLGVDRFLIRKQFGCHGPLVIDARQKPWMAPELVENEEVVRRVDALASGPLSRLLRE